MKVIFLTGHGSKDDFETGIAEGAEYLAKPLQIEALVEKLHQLADA
jgi:DNA-binding response OmpR family regulator